MILRQILSILVIAAATLGLFNYLSDNPNNIVIYWSGHNIEISLANLVAAVLLAFLAFYLALRLLKHIINMGKYAGNYQKRKIRRKTRHGLMQGFLSLIQGEWDRAKHLLLEDADKSEIPVLHFLGAARAAHLQENYAERDRYLKDANEFANGTEIAIAISQAEMQLHAGQLEQARAGLITLLEEFPKLQYAKKLLAKSYYRQEDWKNLSAMLPELFKLGIFNEKDLKNYEMAALKGLFQMYASEENLPKLKSQWKKLPADIRNKPGTVLYYTKALIAAGDNTTANKLMTTTLNKQWDDALAEQFGLSDHDNMNAAIKQAEKWLPEHDKSPIFLLSIARLYRKNQLWGKARNFFESSLNMAPSATGYLEFAELLEQIGETGNANICYRVGLNFCIHNKGLPLILQNRHEAGRDASAEKLAAAPLPPVSDYPLVNDDEPEKSSS